MNCRNVFKIQILFILFKLEPKTPVQHVVFSASIKMKIQFSLLGSLEEYKESLQEHDLKII